jgi:UDP-GlcNAc:undecaprenyl-phosphate/decaprenyl-phosphate GlcNAc-1-phosphate transferase
MFQAVWLPGIVSFALALILTQFCKVLARRTGIVARPKADRWHRDVIPMLGGLGLASAVLITVLIFPPHSQTLWILIGGATILLVTGLWDDVRPLKPQAKFVVQILVATSVAGLGLQLHFTGIPLVDILLTLLWVVGITNALNLLDNMDGLAAGIAAITAGFRLAFFVMDGNMEAAAFAAIVVGASLGFLVHNFNPASIFMGDAGSLFLGFTVSALNLVGTWPYSRSTVSVLLFPVLMLLVPIFDTTFVTLARVWAGRPVSRGGRDHTSHRLVASGLTERQAVLMLYLVATVSGGLAFYAYTAGLSSGIVLIGFLGIFVSLLGTYLARVRVYPESEAPEGEPRFVRMVTRFTYAREVVTVLIDSVLMTLAYYSAYRLRFEENFHAHEPYFAASLPLVLVTQIAAFAAFRVYRGVWRYTGLADLVRLTQAVTFGTGAAVIALVLINRFEGYSRAVFVLDWVLLLGSVAGARISLRALGEMLRGRQPDARRVVIYGGGQGGLLAAREMQNNPGLRRTPVGFLDDDRFKQRTLIYGLPVFGGLSELEAVLDRYDVQEVVIASLKIQPARLSRVIDLCAERGVEIVQAQLRLEKVPDLSEFRG